MYLSLCLIAKDENSYLQEWLDYHILLGVEHFWIYDNESAVPLADSIQDYIKRGWVTVNTIKGRAMQMFAYDHCIQTYGPDSKWIGFIDTDEFIVPNTPKPLATFLEQYEPYGGLAISSLFFGDGGNKTHPVCGQMNGYKTRTSELFSENRLVKLIIQPDKVIFPKDPHTFLFKEGFFAVSENGRRVDAQRYPCHVDTIQINHYFTRSKQEWRNKMARGGGAGITYSSDRWMEVNKFSSVEDTRILDRLRTMLPDSPANWSKVINCNSTELINFIHQAAENIKPQPYEQPEPVQVVPRTEHAIYHQETELALKLFEKGKFIEARELIAGQISQFPYEITRYTNFAVACIQQNDFQTAWSALAQAWRIAPQSLEVLIGMTDYHYNIGNYAQAEMTSLLTAAQGELEPLGIAVLALSQWKQGKIQEAIATAKPILEMAKGNGSNHPLFNELIKLYQNRSR